MVDETQTVTRPEEAKYLKAHSALRRLQDEITELKDGQITNVTAPFIMGLYLARTIELKYLDAFDLKSRNPDFSMADFNREQTGVLQQDFSDAHIGNYDGLKRFGKDMSATFHTTRSAEDKFRQNFDLIAEHIPTEGTPIKAPAPAWMEEPMPLREQLKQLQEGGGKS